MFVELLEKLRCPNEHEPSPLIATASLTKNRHIIEGMLGCPVCHAEFKLHEGALDLGGSCVAPMLADDALTDEKMIRLGALLGLDERGGLYVLDFISSYFAAGLLEFSPHSQFVALTCGPEMDGASAVIIGHGDGIPLAAGCARGIALDSANPKLLRSAVQVLAPGGRLVAPVNANVPQGIAELARDDDLWVGEREAVPVLSKIRRAPR
jgi:uncharacterized protein YbaR (Trm112 family)